MDVSIRVSAASKEGDKIQKKTKKAKKAARASKTSVAGHSTVATTQSPQLGNKDEAQLIRQRLGIEAEDAESSKKRVAFKFSFSCPKPNAAAPSDDDDVQTNIDDTAAEQRDDAHDHAAEHEDRALPGPPRSRTAAKAAMQPDTSGFIPRRVYIGGMPFWYTEDEIRQCWQECGEIEDMTALTFPDSGRFRGIVFITFKTQEGFDAALGYDADELDGKRLVVKRCKAQGAMPQRSMHGPGTEDERPQQLRGRAGATAESGEENTGSYGEEAAEVPKGRKFEGGRKRSGVSGRGSGSDAGGTGYERKKQRTSHDAPPQRVKGYNVLFVGNIPWELSRSAVSELFQDFKPKFVRMFDKPGTRQHKGFAHLHFQDEESVDKAMSMNDASVMGRKLKVMYAQPSRAQLSSASGAQVSKDVIEDGV